MTLSNLTKQVRLIRLKILNNELTSPVERKILPKSLTTMHGPNIATIAPSKACDDPYFFHWTKMGNAVASATTDIITKPQYFK